MSKDTKQKTHKNSSDVANTLFENNINLAHKIGSVILGNWVYNRSFRSDEYKQACLFGFYQACLSYNGSGALSQLAFPYIRGAIREVFEEYEYKGLSITPLSSFEVTRGAEDVFDETHLDFLADDSYSAEAQAIQRYNDVILDEIRDILVKCGTQASVKGKQVNKKIKGKWKSVVVWTKHQKQLLRLPFVYKDKRIKKEVIALFDFMRENDKEYKTKYFEKRSMKYKSSFAAFKFGVDSLGLRKGNYTSTYVSKILAAGEYLKEKKPDLIPEFE